MKSLVISQKHLIFFSFLLLVACKSRGQDDLIKFQEVPLDTSNWSVTDTLLFDFNGDSVEDLLIEYGRFEGASRPKGILVPIVICINNDENLFKVICKLENFISVPKYEINKLSQESFSITQKGNLKDYNTYTSVFEYENGVIFVTKEIVFKKITRSIIDEETDQIIELEPTIDTLHNEAVKIKADEYNFRKFRDSFTK